MSPAAFRCVERTEVDEALWDSFVDESDEAWLYHRAPFQDALATWKTRTDISFAVCDSERNDTIAAIVPAHLVQEPYAKIAVRKIVDVFGGVAMRNDLPPPRRSSVCDFVLAEL